MAKPAARCALEEAPLEEVLRVDQPSEAPVGDEPTVGGAEASPERVPAAVIELPYAEHHDWEASRYAGIFPVLLVLMSQWQWMQRLSRLFGNGWRIFTCSC
jgi:hypothetical protein